MEFLIGLAVIIFIIWAIIGAPSMFSSDYYDFKTWWGFVLFYLPWLLIILTVVLGCLGLLAWNIGSIILGTNN